MPAPFQKTTKNLFHAGFSDKGRFNHTNLFARDEQARARCNKSSRPNLIKPEAFVSTYEAARCPVQPCDSITTRNPGEAIGG